MTAEFSYDPACLDLAEHFLPKDAPEAARQSLAQAIQDAVELWCDYDDESPEQVHDDNTERHPSGVSQ